jgi:hypothetical protein
MHHLPVADPLADRSNSRPLEQIPSCDHTRDYAGCRLRQTELVATTGLQVLAF